MCLAQYMLVFYFPGKGNELNTFRINTVEVSIKGLLTESRSKPFSSKFLTWDARLPGFHLGNVFL